MMTTRADGISPACMIGIPGGTTIGTQARMSAGTTDCTGIPIMAGTMASTTVLTQASTMTGTTDRTMTGMAVTPTTSHFGLKDLCKVPRTNRKNE